MITPLHLVRLRRGSDDLAPLVLLHGFTGSTGTWQRLLPHLPAARSAVALDLVGHGRSPAPDEPAAYTMPAVVASVMQALTTHAVGRAHWIGYSMGGRVALAAALAEPQRVASLTLIGASPGLADPAARAARVQADEALADFIEQAGLAAFVARWMANPLFQTQARLGADYLAQARAARLRNRPHALALTLRGMGTGAMPPMLDRLGQLDLPVLYVAGGEDARFKVIGEDMVRRLRRAELVVVPGSGHAVHIEAPAGLGRAIGSFLDRMSAV